MVKLLNYKTGRIIEAKTVTQLSKKLNLEDGDRCNLYKLLKGTMVRMGDYCLPEEIKKSHKIVTPEGHTIIVKNWVKLAEKRGLRVARFKKLISGEIIYYKGFYLKYNEGIVPKSFKRVCIFEVDGEEAEVSNVKEFAKNNNLSKQTLYNLISGFTSDSKAAKLKGIIYK
jgi:hypothetical protein